MIVPDAPLSVRVFTAFSLPQLAAGMTAPEVARFLGVSYSPALSQCLLTMVVDQQLSLDVVKSARGLSVRYTPTEYMPLQAELVIGGSDVR